MVFGGTERFSIIEDTFGSGVFGGGPWNGNENFKFGGRIKDDAETQRARRLAEKSRRSVRRHIRTRGEGGVGRLEIPESGPPEGDRYRRSQTGNGGR